MNVASSSYSPGHSIERFETSGEVSAHGVIKRRRKPSKLPAYSGAVTPESSPVGAGISTPRRRKAAPTSSAAKITRPCSECGKRFWSWKALFGHMRCHPERQWRGINPPPNFHRPLFQAGPSYSSPLPPPPSPPPPPPPPPPPLPPSSSTWTRLTEEDYNIASCLLMMANGTNAQPASCLLIATSVECTGESDPFNWQFNCACCRKAFGSHQALAGHKSVNERFAYDEEDQEEEDEVVPTGSFHKTLFLPGDYRRRLQLREEERTSAVVGDHKCSICSRVFASGQALGGHKRCHWEKGDEQGVSSSSTTKGCVVDLNQPAPAQNGDSSLKLVLDLRLGL